MFTSEHTHAHAHIPLGISDAVEEAQAKATGIGNAVGQNLLELLPISLGILGSESTILVDIDLFGDVILHLLPVDVDVARVDGALDDHEPNTGNDGEGPADLLGSHTAAVADERAKGNLGQGRLELVWLGGGRRLSGKSEWFEEDYRSGIARASGGSQKRAVQLAITMTNERIHSAPAQLIGRNKCKKGNRNRTSQLCTCAWNQYY